MQKYVWVPGSAGYHLENIGLKRLMGSMTFY